MNYSQEVAEANIAQLKEQFPDIAEFGHDSSKYKRQRKILNIENLSEEDFQKLLQSGELNDSQLDVLRQAEEELDQTSNFSRLLPHKSSER